MKIDFNKRKTFVTLILSLFLLFYSFKSSIDSTSSNKIKFVIHENCNRINGKSWRCCGKVIVYRNGKVSSEVHTSSNRFQGFTGALKVDFYNSNENLIYELYSPLYGVNGNSSRLNIWEDEIPNWVVDSSKSANVTGVHNIPCKRDYFLNKRIKEILKDYITNNKTLKNDFNKKNIKFIIPKNCNRIRETAKRCCGNIRVYKDGLIVGDSIFTNTMRINSGLLYGLKFTFYDSNNKKIARLYSKPIGEKSLIEKWEYKVNKEIIEETSRIDVEGAVIYKRDNMFVKLKN